MSIASLQVTANQKMCGNSFREATLPIVRIPEGILYMINDNTCFVLPASADASVQVLQ